MDYKHVTCQVCQKEFQEGDDIVVCPECGTPVHRACWQKLGHCVNEYRHGTDWEWKNPNTASEVEKTDTVTPAAEQSHEQNSDFGTDVDQDPNTFAPYGANGQLGPYGGYAYQNIGPDGQIHQGWHNIGADEEIGDFTAKEYAEVVQKGSQSYIPKFQRMARQGKKNTWNWAAFFFAPFWFVYRKMYGWGLLALVLCLIIPFCFANQIVQYTQKSMAVYSQAMHQEQTGDADSEQSPGDLPETPNSLSVNQYVILAVQVMAAIFGNYLYKRHCEKLLIRAKQMSGDERGKLLRSRGGTSGLALFLFIIIVYILIELTLNVAARIHSDLATVVWRLFNR